ncbi:MAG: DNA polymerase III subunit alpha [Propionibacteriaceae bacterium]|jgi:error-prone DNA polymerase|nr:DNA polymerase III subunit alpha [Propionibacteriaceae bacterium]
MEFTHLHVASAFSAHYGTARPEALVQAVASWGATHAAITDRDGLYGAVRHVRTCMEMQIKPIVGVDLLVENAPLNKDKAHETKRLAFACVHEIVAGEVTVLARGNNRGDGWASLCRLISAAYPRTHRPGRGSADRQAQLKSVAHVASIVGGDATYNENRNKNGENANGLNDRNVTNEPTCVVLLGPGSDVGQAVLEGKANLARERLKAWQKALPGAIYVEIVCHHTQPGTRASLQHAAAMLRLARSMNVPAVITNATRYLTPDDALTGDVLDAAAQLLPLDELPTQANAQAWLKPPEMMYDLAAQVCEYAGLSRHAAFDLLSTTEALAAECVLDPDADLAWRKPKLPELNVIGISGDPRAILRQRCEDALPLRYERASSSLLARVYNRLDDELETISQFGFETYFLTIADVTNLIRDMNVRVQARGSGVGSLVNYLLRISTVDPLEHDLLFERFLGRDRSSLPDIDLDVESARRHDIYRAIFARYGEHRVSLLSMQSKYRARGATRDAGLALGLDGEQIDEVASSLWRLNARAMRSALTEKPELRELAAQVAEDSRLDLLVDLTERLDRLPTHIAMHPCGVILSNANLFSVTPVQPSGLGLPMSQYDKDDVDDMGLIKLDVLGVRMQSSIAYSLGEIERINGSRAAIAGGLNVAARYISPEGHIDIDSIPLNDEPTFEAIRSTHTLGMFQIESPGQRELVGKMQPDSFTDLIADISLFRPGPMKANMVTPFVNAKLGFAQADYLHPRFRPFLQDSFGVVIYHEHVLRILHECMGVTLAEADEIRRRMGGDLTWLAAQFRTCAASMHDDAGKRVFSDAQLKRIWDALVAFGSFGFCKAHAAAFALTTYQSAWLKTHYPAEFIAGLFEHDPGMYPRRLLMAEARRIGIPILGLDINRSNAHYVVETLPADAADTSNIAAGSRPRDCAQDNGSGCAQDDGNSVRPEANAVAKQPTKGIRLSLRDVKGITEAEIVRLVAGAPYESIVDCYQRARPSSRVFLRLVSVGAFDQLAQARNRGELVSYARNLVTKERGEKACDDQPLLLSATCESVPSGEPDLSHDEKLACELEVLACEVNEHLIECYRPMLDTFGVCSAADLLQLRSNSEVLVAGVRVATQTPPMKTGKRVIFISVDDGTGVADASFFAEAQNHAGKVLFGTRLLLIQGKTRRTGARGISIQAENAWDLKALWLEWQRLGGLHLAA